MTNYKRGYVDGRFGQVHYHRAWPGAEDGGKTPVAFFHQNHKSAFEYDLLLREMGRDREALAFDSPGYGRSDPPPGVPVMDDFAGAMADALDGLGFGPGGKGPVDVFGLHTGVFIASQLALTRPDLVRRIVLSGIPYRTPERRKEIFDGLPRDAQLTEDGTWIMDVWNVIVARRAEGVPLKRAAQVFVEAIHPLEKHWHAYSAVWSYPVEERLSALTHPVAILQPHEMLLEDTRRAHAELLPGAHYVEIPEVSKNMLDLAWEQYAREMRLWLDEPVSGAGNPYPGNP